MIPRILLLLLLSSTICLAIDPPIPGPAIPRMPPVGIAVPPDTKAGLEKGVTDLGRAIDDLKVSLKSKPDLLDLLPDVQIYYNAVRYALDDDIFYKDTDFAAAQKFINEGLERARLLKSGQAPWNTATGLVVRGYQSKIDGSVQPYGLVVPASYQPGVTNQHRLDFWFHGRNNNGSELSFLADREKNRGEFTPEDTIVLHPYGRYCNAYKFAGETDALEALDNVRHHYHIDENRISVRGFSMGGAATWHFAAHYAGMWAAASPGAGFVDTDIFQKLSRQSNPLPWYEMRLWHLYDTTDYAGNLFNCPVVAYSGQIDPQRQAAELMSRAMADVPVMCPAESLIGDRVSEMATTDPSRRCRTVSRCLTCSPRAIRAMRSGSSARRSVGYSSNTGRPMISSAAKPKRRSAPAFQLTTMPSVCVL